MNTVLAMFLTLCFLSGMVISMIAGIFYSAPARSWRDYMWWNYYSRLTSKGVSVAALGHVLILIGLAGFLIDELTRTRFH